MQDGNNSEMSLISLGLGFLLGLGSLLILIELWPLLMIGAGVLIVAKGMEQQEKSLSLSAKE